MALFRPRRWLGYTIKVNDLLPAYQEIVDRFESSEIPLDAAFGSDRYTDPPPTFSIGIGAGVEIERLAELLALLEGLGVERIRLNTSGTSRKTIYLGGYSVESFPEAVLTDELKAKILGGELTSEELAGEIESSRLFRLV